MKIYGNNETWVLDRYVKELQTDRFPNLHYFLPYARYRPVDGVTAALFTHYEPLTANIFEDVARRVDIAIAYSQKTADDVKKFRPNKEVYVIHAGTELHRPLTFGVVGRVYSSGRKGEYLIEALAKEFNFLALGQGWPCPTYAPDTTNQDFSSDLRKDFYSKIDYLVVPSLIEGGPMPVIDALAMGVPVIAPDVGWCWDYSTIHYKRGDLESLRAVLQGLIPHTWEQCREEHFKLFETLLSNK